MDPEFEQDILKISDHKTFRAAALEVFHFQAANAKVYRDYLSALRIDPSRVNEVQEIPFLPIEFFKTHAVICEGAETELIFESSKTTSSEPSRHYLASKELYRESFMRGFERFYGRTEDYSILALLPSYLERSGSSLVYMMDHLIETSNHPQSGFYLNNLADLSHIISELNRDKQPALLVGVTFALLDLAEKYPQPLGDHIILMETGGMKGQRSELTREEVHHRLKTAFGVRTIHSEYGMTELLSQAYSKEKGRFFTPPWMKVLIRDPNDPLSLVPHGQTGGVNVIDLANLYSCSFVATADLGKSHEDGSFEVLGRFDHSEVRGCNLMVL